MNKKDRRQFIKTSAIAGVMGLIAPSFVLSACPNIKSEVQLTIAKEKVFLRLAYWNQQGTWIPLELLFWSSCNVGRIG